MKSTELPPPCAVMFAYVPRHGANENDERISLAPISCLRACTPRLHPANPPAGSSEKGQSHEASGHSFASAPEKDAVSPLVLHYRLAAALLSGTGLGPRMVFFSARFPILASASHWYSGRRFAA